MSAINYKGKFGAFDVFNTLLLCILTLATLFPFYYVVLISLADYAEIHKHLIYIFPTSINFEAYRFVLKEKMFFNSFFISTFITIAGTILSMTLSTAAAYTLSKRHIPGWGIMFTIVMIPMFFSGGLIPYYLTVKNIGLVNQIAVLFIPNAISTFYVLLIKNFFEEMPPSVEESAKIDGANDLYILYKIVLPTSAPVIATISLFYSVDRWNEYYSALLFISDRHKYPLQMVLREVVLNFSQIMSSNIGASIANENRQIYSTSLQMAIITIATIPILLIYPFLQKHFTKGIMLGAVKE